MNANTSYKTLKTMVPDVSNVRAPWGETLVKSDNEILIKVREGSSTVIVYTNGFFAYIDGQGDVTARAVANCHVMKYPKAEGGYSTVFEKDFENMPFSLVLSHFGQECIDDKKRKKVSKHENLSLDDEALPNDSRLMVPDFTENLDMDGEGDTHGKMLKLLPEAMRCLTEQQRKIIILSFFKKMTHEQIAKTIGTSRPFVSKEIKKSLMKMKEYLTKFF